MGFREVFAMPGTSKMTRQLMLYRNICRTTFHGPEELMRRFGIGRRMLQRDLKDLRDAGVIRLELDKKQDNYVESKKDAAFDETAVGRHRQHLARLNRLATLMDKLERTDMEALFSYESEAEEYSWYLEAMEEDPETFPPEDLGDPPLMPPLEDIRASYYLLFPDSNERQRQRDFKALNDAGYHIYYDHRYRRIIFDDPWLYER
ncbi:MAG: hypothetical protein K6E50_15500 [Lachnospiraceae bacterium]|nr:hypothetical protein [Lachnospiraceae bacterium]